MGAFCCHRNQSFDPICPKTLCSLSPTPVMLHIKFDQDWPTAFRDIQVWKCGRQRRTDRPLVYYKLTLWAFGSGELKNQKPNSHLLIYLCSVHNNSNILFKLGRIRVSLNMVGGYDHSHNISVENREIGDYTFLKWNWNLSMLLAIRLWFETIAFHRCTAKQLKDTTQTIQWRIFFRPSQNCSHTIHLFPFPDTYMYYRIVSICFHFVEFLRCQ